MRLVLGSALVLASASLLAPAAFGREAESGGGGSRRRVHDVRVKLSKATETPGGTRVRVTVQNRGRVAESGVSVAVWSDADPANPLWETTTDLRRKGRARWTLVLEVPEGAGNLHASCDLAPESGEDDRPEDNDDSVPVEPAPGGRTAEEAGAAIFVPQCSSCHGAAGTGGSVEEDISDEGAEDILEAVREGEEGMPTFPGITWQDARNIAAYLRNPVAPPTDPGTGGGTTDPGTGGGTTDPGTGTGGGGTTTPTYTGRIAAILTANCTSCHTGTRAPRNIRLDTYSTASANAATSLTAMQGGRMPPGGAMSAGDIDAFRAWIAGGKPR